jgi:predicted PurR-regulated permease PerM
LRDEVHQQVQAVRDGYYELRPLAIQILAPTLEPLPLNLDLVVNDQLRAWLTVQANPSGEQIDELRTALVTRFGPQSLGPLALSTGQYLGGVVGKFLLGLFVMVISLYYFFADGPAMISSVMRLSPLDDKYEEQMLQEFDKISRAVVMATLLSALVQGILGGVGYMLAGLDSLFLLTVLTMLFAMVPFVGAAAVWAPCSLYLLLVQHELGWAIFLAVWGAVVVSMSDNIVKPLILHGQSNLHPLLALLSVIGGVQALGPIGIFVGPMVVSFLQAVLNMFQSELAEFGKKGPVQEELR